MTGIDTETTASAPPRRFTASGVLLGFGYLSALGTLLLWWVGTWSAAHEPAVGREVFGNVPGPLLALFYLTVSGFLFLAFYLMAQRAKNWQRGAAEDRRRLWKRRLHAAREGLQMTTLLRDRQAGLMHSAIYYGFIVLFLGTLWDEGAAGVGPGPSRRTARRSFGPICRRRRSRRSGRGDRRV